ncbi:MAG: 5-dehydro-2-deoxygluconokinase [Pseudomonadota bacterium]|nr:5-dehydro-2-deoxygluconokinase [Pseudomonadota bacterium]
MSCPDVRDNNLDTLDVVCIGRSGVDLYGEQIGGRLEDMRSFAKYVGGSPTNTAIGASRLGLRAGLISRVGDEHNGRFVRETLQAEHVDVSCLRTDPTRLTALVFLGVRNPETFPLVFYRDRCADMALNVDDIDAAYLSRARTVLISGTHLSHPDTRAACVKAIALARGLGRRVVLDIDYRPVLWGLTSPGLGEQRFVPAAAVTEQLQAVLPDCDLIVGTEEEIHIAGGSTDSHTALETIRALSRGLIVMKRGPMGCVAFDGAIPSDLAHGIQGAGFPVEVFNVLGAGDAFMAGLLRGWVRDEPLPQALRYANACGAIVVSRHGCAPAMPTWTELTLFLQRKQVLTRLRDDEELEHVHRATTRRPTPAALAILAFDHRSQLEDIAARVGADTQRIAHFKQLVAQAAELGYAAERALQGGTHAPFPMPGVIVDARYGAQVLHHVTGNGIWIARPVEAPGSRPLAFEDGANVGQALTEWPSEHVIKCLVSHHPDDEPALAQRQLETVRNLYLASRRSGHELLLEVIPPRTPSNDDTTVVDAVAQFYAAGVRPEWWKLPPPSPAAWRALDACITRADPWCRGVLLLGLEAREEELWDAFCVAAQQPLCKGFAVGRTLFAAAAQAWFQGALDDAGVIADVAMRYQRLIRMWQEARLRPALANTVPSSSLNSTERLS